MLWNKQMTPIHVYPHFQPCSQNQSKISHILVIRYSFYGRMVTVIPALTVNNLLLWTLFLDKQIINVNNRDVMEFLEGRSQVFNYCLLVYGLHPMVKSCDHHSYRVTTHTNIQNVISICKNC